MVIFGPNGLGNKWRLLGGFLTVPGIITFGGMGLAFAILAADNILQQHGVSPYLPWPALSADTARQFLSTLAGSAMAALSLVYSTVLVVFTLAAGNIAPRLLQRFSQDRTSQISVGMLGATFLYSIIILWGTADDPVPEVAMVIAVALATLSVLLLLIFVDRAAKRVTVDEEIAAIGSLLEAELKGAMRKPDSIPPGDAVRPDGPDFPLQAGRAGYIDQIDHRGMARTAARHRVFVDLSVMPGDYVVARQCLGRVIGPYSRAAEAEIQRCIIQDRSRNPEGDLRFSVSLLVEIALRALSPGTNDTFTAVACVDRLSSALMPVREQGLALGSFADRDNAIRVTAPAVSASDLIREAFEAVRWSARGNLMMQYHLVRALGRLGQGERSFGEDEVRRQLNLIRADIRLSDCLPQDKAPLEKLIDQTLTAEVGRPLC